MCPSLPIYNSRNNIQPMQSAPFRQEAGQNAANQNQVLNTVTQIAQKWSDANDVMQATEAKTKYEIASAEIQSRAAADPDFNNSPKYFKELEKVKVESLKGVSNQMIAGQLRMDFERGNVVTGMKIGADFQAKQMQANKINIAQSLDIMQQKRLNAVTDVERKQIDGEMQGLINANLAAGVLDYKEADSMIKNAQKTGVQYEIYADTATQEKDSVVLKELKKHNGKYSFLPPDERLDLIEESQRRIFQNNQTFKRADESGKDERFNNIFQKANEGTLTLADLDAEQAAAESGVVGALDQKQILDIRKGVQSRIKSDLELIVESNSKAESYLNFVDTFIDDETDRQKGRELIVKSFKDGILSTKEATMLNSLKREAENIQWARKKADMSQNNLIPFKNAIFAIKEAMMMRKSATEQDSALAIKKLLSSYDPSKIPTTVQQVLDEDAVNRNPSIMTIPEEGQLFIDEDGSVKMIKRGENGLEITEPGE